MIAAQALIDKFRYALNNDWGYIWGAAGGVWTQAQQNRATREQTVKFGQKWVGHHVADCSGLFKWAIKQLGSDIYHGSDTMYRKWCSANGTLNNGKRTDGMVLQPGTAVFVYKEQDGKWKYTHVGLYVGGGTVIEAKGTQAGVVTSKVTEKKWTNWGELKMIEYSGEQPDPQPEPTPEPADEYPTIRKGDSNKYVTLAQVKLISKGYSVGSWGADGKFGNATQEAVRKFQRDHGLTVDGIIGKKTWAALIADEPVRDPTYRVIIKGLDRSQAMAICNNYPGSEMEEE